MNMPKSVSEPVSQPEDSSDAKLGFLAALAAYGAWGFSGLYFSLLSHVSPVEVIANRVVWSLVFLGLFFFVRGRWHEVWEALSNKRVFLPLLASSILISINWLTYVWAVGNGRATEASFGYFIMPLINVVTGYFLLSERLSKLQLVAIGIVVAAIVLQTVLLGSLPIVSLVLSFSFGAYGYIRKTVPVGANLGLLIELVLMAPFAFVFVFYLQASGQGHLGFGDLHTLVLLVLSGLMTYLPLMWFSTAARRLKLSTIGIMQYMNPSLQLFVAITFLGESVGPAKLIAFCLIWVSIAIYSYDAFHNRHSAH